MKFFIIVFSVLFLNCTAFAQQNYNTSGDLSCGSVLEYKDGNVGKYAVTKFVQGYITGRNYERALENLKQVREMDFDSLFLATIKYCDENPLDRLVHAAEDIYTEIVTR